MITKEQLIVIMPTLRHDHAAYPVNEMLPRLNECLTEFEINTPLRIAAFLAQIAHESGELRFWEELGGKKYLSKYEGRVDLGNTEPGDGYRYRGRGVIQLTGRENYQQAGKVLGIDLIGNPRLAASLVHGFRIAGYYWQSRNCNILADQNEFDLITRRINGALRGKPERDKYYIRAKLALAIPVLSVS